MRRAALLLAVLLLAAGAGASALSACQPGAPAAPAVRSAKTYGNMLLAAKTEASIVRAFIMPDGKERAEKLEWMDPALKDILNRVRDPHSRLMALLPRDSAWEPFSRYFCLTQDRLVNNVKTMPHMVTQIVKQHLFNVSVHSSQFTDGLVLRSLDDRVKHTLVKNGDLWQFAGESAMHGPVTLLEIDIKAGAGIVHIIDTPFRDPDPYSVEFWKQQRDDSLQLQGAPPSTDCCAQNISTAHAVPVSPATAPPASPPMAPLAAAIAVSAAAVLVAVLVALVAWSRWRRRQLQLLHDSDDGTQGGSGGSNSSGGSGVQARLIEYAQLEFGDPPQRLGSGADGDVWLGRYFNSMVAIKEFRLPQPSSRLGGAAADTDDAAPVSSVSQAPMALCRREVELLTSLNHPNLVRLIGVVEDAPQGCPLLVLEFYQRGSVFDIIRRARAQQAAAIAGPDVALLSSWSTRLRMLREVAGGMWCLHSQNMVHGDLRSPNVFVASDGTVRIGDFGFAKALSSEAVSVRRLSHPSWMAPELMRDGQLSRSADVYSFGCLMYELLTWQQPFEGTRRELVPHRVLSGERPKVPPLEELPCGTSVAGLPAFERLMHRCWHSQPDERPTFEAIGSELAAMLPPSADAAPAAAGAAGQPCAHALLLTSSTLCSFPNSGLGRFLQGGSASMHRSASEPAAVQQLAKAPDAQHACCTAAECSLGPFGALGSAPLSSLDAAIAAGDDIEQQADQGVAGAQHVVPVRLGKAGMLAVALRRAWCLAPQRPASSALDAALDDGRRRGAMWCLGVRSLSAS